MSLVINNNLMALNAARSLGSHFGALETSTRRLSSGLRITQSSDDAAGLAVRELMRAEISSLQQGIRNANDAISLIQTADGALGVIDEKLIRMKELAMQASTGTYNSDQRLIIDSEYQAMAREITRIASSTDFNGIYLLNGNLSGIHSGSGMNPTGQLKVHFGTGNDSSEDYYYIQIGIATSSALGLGSSFNGYSRAEMIAFTAAIAATRLPYRDETVRISRFGDWGAARQADFRSTGKTFDDDSIVGHVIDENNLLDVMVVAQATDGSIWKNESNAVGVMNNNYLATQFREAQNLTGASPISTQQLAQEALATLDNAIISKDKIRANLGALQNRLENTVTTLEIQAENLQAAESRISDVDVAKEMTNFVRNQILTQAAVSMLAQANSLPRMALSLIG